MTSIAIIIHERKKVSGGLMPEKFSTALAILGMLMESTHLDEIDFEVFNVIAGDIDNFGPDLLTEE